MLRRAATLTCSALVAVLAVADTGPGPAGASRLAAGVWLIPGSWPEGGQPDGNTVLLAAPDGLVAVDTGRRAAHAEAILAAAAEQGRPLAAVVNTHWHLDHVGGNALLRERVPGLEVHASDALREALGGFLERYREQLEGALVTAPEGAPERESWRAELALLAAGPRLLPDRVVTASGPRSVAGRRLELHLETSAVTAGDVWLLDPTSGVLVAGDLVTLPVPFFDTACPERWRPALDRLAAQPFTTLVPGHGPPLSREAVERYRRGFGALLDCAASAAASEACADRWLADMGGLVPESEHARTREAIGYYLEQHLRAPPERLAGLCGAAS